MTCPFQAGLSGCRALAVLFTHYKRCKEEMTPAHKSKTLQVSNFERCLGFLCDPYKHVYIFCKLRSAHGGLVECPVQLRKWCKGFQNVR